MAETSQLLVEVQVMRPPELVVQRWILLTMVRVVISLLMAVKWLQREASMESPMLPVSAVQQKQAAMAY